MPNPREAVRRINAQTSRFNFIFLLEVNVAKLNWKQEGREFWVIVSPENSRIGEGLEGK